MAGSGGPCGAESHRLTWWSLRGGTSLPELEVEEESILWLDLGVPAGRNIA